MFRSGLLWLSERESVSRFARHNGLARKMARRFVAGDTAEEAFGAIRKLNDRGITATVDLLGESVSRVDQAHAARDEYFAVLDQGAKTGIDSHVSVKLTQMGLDIDEGLCTEHIAAIIDRARSHDSFVRIDMEGSAYTERTLRMFYEVLQPEFGECVGVVIQSALRRSEADVTRLLAKGARVRLCKGAYKEAAAVAFPRKSDVDRMFERLLELLLAEGNYPAIATHDERLITHARAFAAGRGIPPERFEFQMIYGVRRDLQQELKRQGYNVRVYVPYGEQWYPYLMRRLAERPANLGFFVGSLLKESARHT
jgi:proline dehydrogenase